MPADPGSLVDVIPQDIAARAVARLLREQVTDGEFWLTAGPNAIPLAEMVEMTSTEAERLGRRVPEPRMIPSESVNRLLLPLMEDVIPRRQRFKFRQFLELMTLFQSPSALPSSLGDPRIDIELSYETVVDAFRRSIQYWAVRHGLMPATLASVELDRAAEVVA